MKFNTGEAGSRWEAALLELEQCGNVKQWTLPLEIDVKIKFAVLRIRI